MIRDRHNVIPLTMAVMLHMVIGASMIFAFDFTSRQPPPMPLVIKGSLVADSTVVVPPPPVERPKPQPEPVVDTAAQERARIEAETEKRRQDALIEQQRLEELRRQQEADRIKAALGRIEEREFGFCLKCGDEVAEKRLMLDPSTPNCTRCAG